MSGMNGFSLADICCLLCCPPVPSRIAAKLAFVPPEPSYTIVTKEDGTQELVLTERAEWQFNDRELSFIDCFTTRSSKGNKVACMMVRPVKNPLFTILFSHGNAVDLGQMSSFYVGLGTRLNCNIFSYDYSGYGASSGRPSERNIYADIEAAWNALRTRFGVSTDKIVLYGQSIGTVPTIDLASRYEVRAVILHSPLASGLRVACPDTKKTWCFDVFPSIEKIAHVQAPTLIIHGTEDEVIDFSAGLQLYERCPKPVDPLWVEGAGHNDIELYAVYLDRLKSFLEKDLANK